MLKRTLLLLVLVITVMIGGLVAVPVLSEVQAKPCNTADGAIGLHSCDPTPPPPPPTPIPAPPDPVINFYLKIGPTYNVLPNAVSQTQAFCNTGDVAVGGGFIFGSVDGPNGPNAKSELRVVASAPGGDDVWFVSAHNSGDIIEWPMATWARCADLSP